MEDKVLAELKKHFRPEFLNRVDDVIIFQSLDESELARIVDIQLGRLEQRLAQQNLTLDVDAAAKKLLASEGYDPQFGARPLKRAIQEHLLDPLATKLLAGEFKPGDKIKVTAKRKKPSCPQWKKRGLKSKPSTIAWMCSCLSTRNKVNHGIGLLLQLRCRRRLRKRIHVTNIAQDSKPPFC
jgi:hypothetical protein